MGKEFILGLDIGSSSVRGGLFDTRGSMVRGSLVRIERKLRTTSDGGAEISANASLKQVVSVTDDVLSATEGVNGVITHIAACTFWHSLLGISTDGRPTTPVFGWADNRSRDFVARFRKDLSEAETHNRTGAHFHSSFWPAKLMWLRSEHPELWRTTAKWISIGDFLQQGFTGRVETGVSIASGTGVFDIRNCVWDEQLTAFLKLKPSALPDIAIDNGGSELLSKWQRRWPRLKDALWLPSLADGAANSIGSGCGVEGRIALMVGTSGAMRVVINGEPPKKIPSGLFCYRIDQSRVVLGGALSDGGDLYGWLKRNLRIDLSDAAIGKEMGRRGADAHGLTFMPFFAGERSTGYNELAAGSIIGLTIGHDAIDILQAAMEAVAYRFAEILERIEKVRPVTEIVASGGALHGSPVWTQILADVLGRDLKLSSEPEASLRGAVLLALANTGKIEVTDRDSAFKNTKVTFHPKCHAIYKLARKRHQGVYEQT